MTGSCIVLNCRQERTRDKPWPERMMAPCFNAYMQSESVGNICTNLWWKFFARTNSQAMQGVYRHEPGSCLFEEHKITTVSAYSHLLLWYGSIYPDVAFGTATMEVIINQALNWLGLAGELWLFQRIESTTTTSMEDVSTGVLEKIKNIWEVKVKPKNDMMYQDIYNCMCQNTKKNEDILSSMSNLHPNLCL